MVFLYTIFLFGNMDLYILSHFYGVILSQEERRIWQYLENTRSQLGHIFLKHDSRAKDQNGNYIKFGNEEIDTNRTHLN